jgi:hypothetical protein
MEGLPGLCAGEEGVMTAERVVLLDGKKVTERTAKRMVRARRPDLQAEMHKTNGGSSYYLIRSYKSLPRALQAGGCRETGYLSEGETEPEAWLNAAEKLAAATRSPVPLVGRIDHDDVEKMTGTGQKLSEPGITVTYLGKTPRVPRRWAVDVEGRPRTVARSPGRVMFNVRVARRARSK